MPGTVYIDPGPDDSLEVGEAYTPAGIGDTMGAAEAPIVTFSFSFETEDGKKEARSLSSRSTGSSR
ncbi:hypothetical protein ACFQS4_00980 [Saliphagus sp. GCM10025317]